MQRQLSIGGKFGYATGIYGVFIVWMMVAFYLLYFYTDVMGLTPGQAGLVFFVASMWDAITDPVMGWIIDKTRTRWGKYRPYLLLATVPFAACFVAIFYVPDLSGSNLFLWALVVHIVFRTFYTAVYIPYTGLIARLTDDADERSSIVGVKSVFISMASVTVSFLGLPAVTYFGGEDQAVGFLRTALLGATLCITALWVCFLVVREKTTTDADEKPPPTFAEMLSALTSNRAFLLIFIGVLLFTGCYTILNKSIVYFFKYNLGDLDAARWALTAIAVAGILSPAFWVPIAHRTSKKFVWMSGCILAASGLLFLHFAEFREVTPIVVTLFVTGCGIHGFLMMFFAMVADAVDYGEWKNGQRIEAPMFGMISFANKTSLALGTWVLTFMLGGIGYVPNVEQSPETLSGLRQIMTLVPVVGFLGSAVVILFFPFNSKQHRKMIQEIRERYAT